MEPLQKHKHTVKGMEVLYFDNAMLEKTKAGQTSFATMGPLNVIYLKKYDRFVLRLNNWMYPLIRRLPIVGPGRGEMTEPTYIMPAAHGFVYKLKIVGEPNPNLISNLECILNRNSRLVHKGEQMSSEQVEIMSPDDRVVRRMPGENETAEVVPRSMMVMMTGTMMMTGPHRVPRTGDMRKDRKMGLMSRDRKMNLKTIKNRDWRKEAKSRIRNYVATTEKVSQEFMDLRKNNKNLTETKEYDMLKNIGDMKLPVFYIHREEIEDTILKNKDMVAHGDYDVPQMMAMKTDNKPEESAGIVSRVWNYIFGKSTANTTPSTPSKVPIEVKEKVSVVKDSRKGESKACEGPIKEAVKVMAEEAMVQDPKKVEQMISKDWKMMTKDHMVMDPTIARDPKMMPKDVMTMDSTMTKDPKMMPKRVDMTRDPKMMPRDEMTMDPTMTRDSKMMMPRGEMKMGPMMTMHRGEMTMNPVMTRDQKMMPKDSKMMDPMMERDEMTMSPTMTRDPNMMIPRGEMTMDPMMHRDTMTMNPTMTRDQKIMPKNPKMMDPMMTRDPKMMTPRGEMTMDSTMTRDPKMMMPIDTMTMGPKMMPKDLKMMNPMMTRDEMTMDPMMTRDPMMVMPGDAMTMNTTMPKGEMMMPTDVMTTEAMLMAVETMMEEEMAKDCTTESDMTEGHMKMEGHHKPSRKNKKGSSGHMTGGKKHGIGGHH